MGDMFNHASSSVVNMAYTYDYEKDLFKMVTTRPIKKGEEIFICYMNDVVPHRTWNHFWIDYGFVEDCCIEKFGIELGMQISERDAFHEMKSSVDPEMRTFEITPVINPESVCYINFMRFKFYE